MCTHSLSLSDFWITWVNLKSKQFMFTVLFSCHKSSIGAKIYWTAYLGLAAQGDPMSLQATLS